MSAVSYSGKNGTRFRDLRPGDVVTRIRHGEWIVFIVSAITDAKPKLHHEECYTRMTAITPMGVRCYVREQSDDSCVLLARA